MSTSRRGAKASSQDNNALGAGSKSRTGSKNMANSLRDTSKVQNSKVKSVPSSEQANKNNKNLITLTPEERELYQRIKKTGNKKLSDDNSSESKNALPLKVANEKPSSANQNKLSSSKITDDKDTNQEGKRSKSYSKSPERNETKNTSKKKKLVIEEKEIEENEESEEETPMTKPAIDLSIPDPLTNLVRDQNGRLTPKSDGYEFGTKNKPLSTGKLSANSGLGEGNKKNLTKNKSSAQSTNSNEDQTIQEKSGLGSNKFENMLEKFLEDSQWDIQIDVQRIEKDERYVMSQSLELNEGLEIRKSPNEQEAIVKPKKSLTMESIESLKEPPRRKILENNAQISEEKLPQPQNYFEEDSEVVKVIVVSGTSQEQDKEIHSPEYLGGKRSKGKGSNVFDREEQKRKLQDWMQKNKQSTEKNLISKDSDAMLIESEKSQTQGIGFADVDHDKELSIEEIQYQEINSSEQSSNRIVIEDSDGSEAMEIEERGASIESLDILNYLKGLEEIEENKAELSKTKESINSNVQKSFLNTQAIMMQAPLTQVIMTQNKSLQENESDLESKKNEKSEINISNNSFNQNNDKLPYKHTQFVPTPLNQSVQENSSVNKSNNELDMTSNLRIKENSVGRMEVEKESDEIEVLDRIQGLEEISGMIEITGVRVSGKVVETQEEDSSLRTSTQNNQYLESQELTGIPKERRFAEIISSLEKKVANNPSTEKGESEHSEVLENINELAEIEDMKEENNNKNQLDFEARQELEDDYDERILQKVIEEYSEKDSNEEEKEEEEEERVIMPSDDHILKRNETTQENQVQQQSDQNNAQSEEILPSSKPESISKDGNNKPEAGGNINSVEDLRIQSSSEFPKEQIIEEQSSESSEAEVEPVERNIQNQKPNNLSSQAATSSEESEKMSEEEAVGIEEEKPRENLPVIDEEQEAESSPKSVEREVIIEEKSPSGFDLESEGKVEEALSESEVQNRESQAEEQHQRDNFSDEELNRLIEIAERSFEQEQALKNKETNQEYEEDQEEEKYVEKKENRHSQRSKRPEQSILNQKRDISPELEDLTEKEFNNPNFSKSLYSKNNSYSVYEDWKLLEAMDYYISKNGTEGLRSKKTWDNIKDPITKRRLLDGARTGESMRNRIRRHLNVITEKDHKKIREWINNHSEEEAKNYICRFENGKTEADRKFIGICRDPYSYYPLPVTKPKVDTKLQKSDQTIGSKKIVGKVEQAFENSQFDDIESLEEIPKFNYINNNNDNNKNQNQKSKDDDSDFLWEELRKKGLDSVTEDLLKYEYQSSKKPSVKKIQRKDDFKMTALPPRVSKSQVSYEPSVSISEKESIQLIPQTIPQREKVNRKRKDYGLEGKPILLNEAELKRAKPDNYYEQKSLLISEAFKSKRTDDNFDLPRHDIVICVNLQEQYRQYVVDEAYEENESQKFIFEKLSHFALKYSLPQEEINNLFHLVSNDFDDLETYLKTKNDALLWTPSEDDDLLEGNLTALRYLKLLKGEERIAQRRLYLIGE